MAPTPGDPTCRNVMDRARRAVAAACVGYVNTFNPHRIVIGGSIAEAEGERLLQPIRDAIASEAFDVVARHVTVVPAMLGGDVSLAGAQPLVMSRLNQSSQTSPTVAIGSPGRGSRRYPRMTVRVGINGFGRIGRQSLKAILERAPDVEVVAVNDLVDTSMNALLFKHDSTYGAYEGTVEHTDDALIIDGREIKVLQEKDPATLPWGDLGVDLVLESTGLFTDAEKARAHIQAGARKVIISAPAKGEDITIVLGVNEDKYDPANHHVISNASCTTNCLAPAAKVVHDTFGIERGLMNTIHSYTNDQRILDVAHKDPRRARAAGQNIIPTTTGAAKALALVIPDLKGKFDGFSLRVPTPTVSVVDFTADLARSTTADEVNEAFRAAAAGPMKGILGVSDEPLVSSDFRGDSRSSIIDSESTMVLGGTMVKVIAWYDNEWGYSCRCADLIAMVASKLPSTAGTAA